MKIGNRFILSGLLVLMTLLATMMLTTVTSFAATSINVDGGTSQDLQKAIDEASSGSSISISDTITIDETININKDITLIGSGRLVRKSGFGKIMIKINNYCEVVMDGITIDGNGVKCNKPAVYIYHAIFIMESGTIQNNNDSGVYNDCGTFEMIGGTISENKSLNGGGVYNNSGTFKMINGTIYGNQSCYGGGVYNIWGTFEMTDGTISGNKSWDGGGVCNSSGTFKMIGGTISENKASYGGGIYNAVGATFEMTGGKITSNKAGWNGGGVYNGSGRVKITEGSVVITGNSPEDRYGC